MTKLYFIFANENLLYGKLLQLLMNIYSKSLKSMFFGQTVITFILIRKKGNI